MFSVRRVTALPPPAGRAAGRGSVDGSAWNARGHRAAAHVLGFLRTHHHRLGRVESLLALLGAGEVAIDRRGGAKLVGAEQRFERAVDFGENIVFQLLPVFERLLGGLRIVGRRSLRARFSRLPRVSSTETASGSSPSTALDSQLADRRHVLARTIGCRGAASPGRWPWRASAMSRKSESLGKVMWTRACSTSASDITERSSSPSSAR